MNPGHPTALFAEGKVLSQGQRPWRFSSLEVSEDGVSLKPFSANVADRGLQKGGGSSSGSDEGPPGPPPSANSRRDPARGPKPGGRVVRVTPLGVVTDSIPSAVMLNRQPRE